MSRRTLVIASLLLTALLAPHPAAGQDARPATPCEIQGSGAQTGMADVRVVVEGIVTGDFVDTVLDGFFIQAPGCDADPATSDGLWVYDGNRDVAVAEGDRVRVTGRVDEFYDLTEVILDTMEVIQPAAGVAIAPVGIDLPEGVAEAATYLEAFESMVVDPGPIRIVGATNAYGDAYAVPAASDVQRIYLGRDTGHRLGVTVPTGWGRYDHGDVLSGAIGPLNFNYGNFKVAVPAGRAGNVAVERSGIVPEVAPPSQADELTIASYNLENFFDTMLDPGKDDKEWTPTPARYAVNVARRARSIGQYLGAPDILAVEEVEKQAVLEDLARHPALAAARYEALLIEGFDLRGIDVGMMYRRDKLRVLAASSEQYCGPMSVAEPNLRCTQADGSPGWMLYSRPPLAVRFQVIATGGRITVIVNHFKSKRGGDDATTPVRVAMAGHNVELFDRLKGEDPDVPVVIVGDLNDFDDAAPLLRLTDGGKLVNLHLVPRLAAPERGYSFIFNGVSQVLDHMLVEPTLEPRIRSFRPLHINIDFGSPAPDDDSMESPRTSDHDPGLARIDLRALPVPRPAIYLPVVLATTVLEGNVGDPPLPAAGTSMATPAATATDVRATDVARPTPTAVRPTATSRPPATATTSGPPPPTPTPGAPGGAPPKTPLRIDDLFFDGEEPMTEGDEYIEFTNVSAETVFLTGWRIVSVQGPQTYSFPSGFSMAAGKTCRVYTNRDFPEHCGLSWKAAQGIWANAGDKAEIRDAGGRLIDWWCYRSREGECAVP